MANNKKSAKDKKIVKQYMELLYMTPKEITAKDIAEVLKENEGAVVELWESMNVVEMEIPDGGTADFEPMKAEFKDPSDMAFVKNREIQTIFAVTVCEDDFEEISLYLKDVVEQLGGFICADSEDFKPFYVGR